jgi:Gpi18-like mannosyltransferase
VQQAYCNNPELLGAYFCHLVVNFRKLFSCVQQAYWNNGFLNYWELKQVPNFLVAVPILSLVLATSYNFVW